MELLYNESQLIRAQAFKIAAAIVSLAALAGEFIAARNLIFVPLPSAFLTACNFCIVFSVTMFSVISSLPMKMRFINPKCTQTLINIFLSISLTASVCCLFTEALDVYSYLFEGSMFLTYSIKFILRGLFFVLIFLKEQTDNQDLRIYITLSGTAYSSITVFHCFYNYGYIDLSTAAMLISVAIVMIFEIRFYNLESAYVFSAISHRKYFLNNSFDELKSFSYAYVVDFLWQENSLHLLVYTSNAEYLDIEYLPFSACFFAENACDEKRFNCFYFDAVIHRIERLNSTNSRL